MSSLLIAALDAIEGQLAVIQIANGYSSDAGLRIFRGRTQFDARKDEQTGQTIDEFPVLSLKLGALRPGNPPARQRFRPEDARNWLADVEVSGAALYEGSEPENIGPRLLVDIWRAVKLKRPVLQTKDLIPVEGRVIDAGVESGVVVVTQVYGLPFFQRFGEG